MCIKLKNVNEHNMWVLFNGYMFFMYLYQNWINNVRDKQAS